VAALIVGVSWQAGPAAAPAAAQASPPTTKSLLDGILSKLLPTTTVKPPVVVTPPPASPTAAKPATAPAASSATTTTRPADAPRVIPPEYLGIINSVRRSGPRSTAALFDALRPLLDLGISQQEAAIAAMGHFPVAGETSYTDDWLDPRFTPAFHLHQGTDLFAARGTPVRAPYDGVVRFTEEGAGGKAAYLTVPDGTYYYMAHLDGFARKFSSGSAVKQGDVVGYVGNTGNAFDSSPHVHFEIHPRGGAAVNPKPVLDGWLGEALAALPNLLASYNVDVPRAVTAAGILRRFEKASPGASSPSMAPLLWASAVSAGGGSLRLAELQVARVAGRIDWQRRATDQQAQADALREGRDLARALLRPLTPPAMVPLLGGAS
jgi:murein DD-endopeptidase MepM/ murein hydrolase activator NlpD